jgi:hypothetical protein
MVILKRFRILSPGVTEDLNAEKEYLYIGHYVDTLNRYVLKVGTTNDLKRRRYQHNTSYRKARKAEAIMPQSEEFTYDWHIRLSKYNTLRYEDRIKSEWVEAGFGKYLNNDRFIFPSVAEKPEKLYITIRKTYEVVL